jgi:hypothetical protein
VSGLWFFRELFRRTQPSFNRGCLELLPPSDRARRTKALSSRLLSLQNKALKC